MITKAKRQIIFFVMALVVQAVMIGLLHLPIIEPLIVIGFGAIIMKLTDIEDTIEAKEE